MEREIVYRPDRPGPDPVQLKVDLERLGRLLNMVQLENPSMMRRPKVLFLDFDGPLATPWAANEDPQLGVLTLIRELASRSDLTLCLVSFNPGAEAAVTRWGIRDCFTAVRAGCNWERRDEEYTEEHRRDLSKPNQIRSILMAELQGRSYEASFLDDDPKNLLDVYEQFYGEIKCFYIHDGLTCDLVERLIN